MKIAIIGSGISALTAARKLNNTADVTIFDKSKGIGGRIATRRADPFVFDHGAQYFLIKNNDFESFVSPFIERGIVKRWDAYFKEFEGGKVIRERQWGQSFAHYVGVPNMNAFCKSLAENLNIIKNSKIHQVIKSDIGLRLVDDKNIELGIFDWVISTVPSKQAIDILPKNLNFIDEISSIKMSPCFTLMLGFENDLNLGFDAAMIHNELISWVSVNSSKPDRKSNYYSLVIQSTNRWADKNLNLDRNFVITKMISEASNIISRDLNKAVHKEVHGWHYANAPKRDLGVYIDYEMKVAACGDWCMHGRVESAYLSGKKTAEKVMEALA
ncbi:MAG: NAD(P)-binding protein [Verrucomicrobiota bacterium]|nr:NAD(P)-binding protein [Verrucomicrobiota bacterium]